MNSAASAPIVQISFRHLDPSPVLESQVRKDLAKLEDCFARISRCQVWIEKLGHGHLHGGQYEVRVELNVPGSQLMVRHRSAPDEDAFLAVRAAFHVARRRLDDYLRQLRGEVKRHVTGS